MFVQPLILMMITSGAGVGAERPREARRALAGARAVVARPVT